MPRQQVSPSQPKLVNKEMSCHLVDTLQTKYKERTRNLLQFKIQHKSDYRSIDSCRNGLFFLRFTYIGCKFSWIRGRIWRICWCRAADGLAIGRQHSTRHLKPLNRSRFFDNQSYNDFTSLQQSNLFLWTCCHYSNGHSLRLKLNESPLITVSLSIYKSMND